MRGRDLQSKVFPGGINNKVNIITMRTGGSSTAVYNDLRTGQTGASGTGQPGGFGKANGYLDPDGVSRRITGEQDVERSRNDGTKNTDI